MLTQEGQRLAGSCDCSGSRFPNEDGWSPELDLDLFFFSYIWWSWSHDSSTRWSCRQVGLVDLQESTSSGSTSVLIMEESHRVISGGH